MSTFVPSGGSPQRAETLHRQDQHGVRGAGRLGIGLAVLAAVALVAFGVVVWANRQSPETSVARPRIVSMEASARAMQQAGAAMQTHGQAMLDEGRTKGDQDLTAHGEHWLRDAAMLMQGGQWMAMNPLAAGNLVSSPGELAAQGNLETLNRAVQNMIHDPSRARTTDIEALRWNGLSMQGEGQNMADHARVMAEEVKLMVERHGLQGQALTDAHSRPGDARRGQGADSERPGDDRLRRPDAPVDGSAVGVAELGTLPALAGRSQALGSGAGRRATTGRKS